MGLWAWCIFPIRVTAGYQMGETILGMPGPWAKNYRETSDHYTTKIGGIPDWPTPKEAIRPDLLECELCKAPLCLVAQVYAPIATGNQKIEERVVYILGCVMPECGSNPDRTYNSSWRAIRIQKSHTKAKVPDMVPSVSTSEIVPSDNSCGVEQVSGMANNERDADNNMDLLELGAALSAAASSFSDSQRQSGRTRRKATKKRQHSKPSTNVKDISMPVLPCFYIYPKREKSSGGVNDICASYSSLAISSAANQPDDSGEAWEQEAYEYDRALGTDRTYLKFKKRMDANPEQCFRYSYRGRPIIATADLRDPTACARCGACRQFELQLMPPVLYFLHEAVEGLSIDGWNWLTIIIYTCSKSCSLPSDVDENGWIVAEEVILLQHEG